MDESGAVYAIDDDEDMESTDSVFAIANEELKLAIRSFIKWRVNVANKLKI